MNAETSPERAAIVLAGAAAARDGVPRSGNPHPVESEDWTSWMDGFDHQTIWSRHGRGRYDPFADAGRDA